jgi:hypothetical protein
MEVVFFFETMGKVAFVVLISVVAVATTGDVVDVEILERLHDDDDDDEWSKEDSSSSCSLQAERSNSISSLPSSRCRR